MTHHDLDDHDLGLSADLPLIVERQRALGRRGLLRLLGGAGLTVAAGASLAACGDDSTAASSSTSSSSTASTGATASTGTVDASAGEIPEETAGPYPGDGSNGVNVLSESGVVRSDLTSSFGDASGVAEGVPTTVRLRVLDLEGEDVSPLAGAAVYLWHCDREGRYSLYSDGVTEENYLRGVQATDDDGRLEFTTIFPACYDGRWPHMHFEVYRSLDAATSYTEKMRTSQLALPQEVCDVVYATDGYEASVDNLARLSLDSDMVFADGHTLQLATVTGSVGEGYVVSLNVPV
jgi:protocatechuate 3,4-dioxygenase beta subunit